MACRLFEDFFEILTADFTLGGGITVKFLRREKNLK